ncbi:type II toxin-antitoxin system YafQ family toxin [Mucilaginibacter litoreus]|uniref:Type II toxin-antitoxin system YafQ family toxin n=1 Tax=Mucilaginibacter litoreus TaxID=1048221 RepID=A0ABW3AV35_9SPHI
MVLSKAFEKSYKKFANNNQSLKSAILKTVSKMELDVYHPSLRTHKLSGKLAAYLACSCGYDCRIIFTIETDLTDINKEVILLLDVGTHNDVY